MSNSNSSRKSRFHTASNTLCLNPFQIVFALSTTILRKVFGYYLPIPWLVLPALRALSKEIPGKDIFEFGSGTSTRWYAKRCKSIIAIEDNKEWYDRVTKDMASVSNATLLFESGKEAYSQKLNELQTQFDVVIVDGSYRLECLRHSVSWVRPGGVILVDNTDQQKDLAQFIADNFPREKVMVFSGYAPGNFYAKETTIIRI